MRWFGILPTQLVDLGGPVKRLNAIGVLTITTTQNERQHLNKRHYTSNDVERVSLHPKNMPCVIDRMRGCFTNTMHMLHAQGRFEQHLGAKKQGSVSNVRWVATSIRTRHMIPPLLGGNPINKGIDKIAAITFHSW